MLSRSVSMFAEAIEPMLTLRESMPPAQVWAMVELQRLSGMRPGEVVTMRTCDLDTSGRVWAYTPESHKTEHHGREPAIPGVSCMTRRVLPLLTSMPPLPFERRVEEVGVGADPGPIAVV